MGPALAVGHEGTAEIFDVDCTAPITRIHCDRASALLPDGVEILDAQPLLPGAPSLGRLLDSVRYHLAPPASGNPWPETPDNLDDVLRGAIHDWQLTDGGGLRVEINARQQAGPTPSVKKVLMGLGLDEAAASRARATREMLVLRPRKKLSKPADVVGAASR
jgi:hypothetical protein